MKDSVLSVHRLLEEYVGEREAFEYPIHANNNSFYVVKESDPKYVQPVLKELNTNCEKEELPQVLCVAATGASGKSALAEYISAEKHCPIFNLGEHPAVADSALVGVLYNSLGYNNITPFLDNLNKGRSLIIIDGADEGMVKVGNFDAFKNFLKGLADIAQSSSRTSFIILGRISAMEIVNLVLDEYNVKTRYLKIEAFTEDQAKDFINKHTGKNESDTAYKGLRDYILRTIGNIFKNPHDIKTSNYQKFIGYAPVLMAISRLISNESNPHRLYQELLRQNVKSIDLLVAICESILQRDKENKIYPLLLKGLIENRNESFRKQVQEKVYSNTEQCYRVLAKAMNEDVALTITGDHEFDMHYEDQIKSWVDDHPFYDLDKHRIQNTVFESYIIAKLLPLPEYNDLVYKYLRSRYKDAFILFYIYDAMFQHERRVDHSFLPYLLSSAHSLDDKEHRVDVRMEEGEQGGHTIKCQITVISSDKNFDFNLEIIKDQSLYLGDYISNSTIIVPSLNVELNRLQSTLTAPVFIQCATLLTKAGDYRIEASSDNDECRVVIDCEKVAMDFTNGQSYRFYTIETHDTFMLLSDEKPVYPFEVYWKNEVGKTDLNKDQVKVYQKLRRTFCLFKSHSKGRLAKYKDKIDNRRWLGSNEWQFLLQALLDNGVFYIEDNFYFISQTHLSDTLGVSYDQLKNGVITEKIVNFIKLLHP